MKAYVASVRSFQALIYFLPIGVHLLRPDDLRIFPPLGSGAIFALPFICILVGRASLLPLLMTKINLLKFVLFVCVLVSLISMEQYQDGIQKTILSIEIGSQHEVLYKSIGTKRTAFANKFYSGIGDEDMLKSQGFREDDIERLWTRDSINSARTRLLRAYLCFLCSVNFAKGCLAQILEVKRELGRPAHNS